MLWHTTLNEIPIRILLGHADQLQKDSSRTVFKFIRPSIRNSMYILDGYFVSLLSLPPSWIRVTCLEGSKPKERRDINNSLGACYLGGKQVKWRRRVNVMGGMDEADRLCLNICCGNSWTYEQYRTFILCLIISVRDS